MEHVIVTELENGMVRLVPETGYRLYCTSTCLYYSQAIVKAKDRKFFVAEQNNR